jgi:hypothetical protein
MNPAEPRQFRDPSDFASTVMDRPPNDDLHPTHDLLDYAKYYARERPEVVAMWCFGIGFILGWKLKPW